MVTSSFCGVVGLKSTYGSISRYGIMPLAPSMDHVGCITKSVWDAAAVLECISNSNSNSSKYSFHQIKNLPITKIIEEPMSQKISIGIPKNYFLDCLDNEVERTFYNFINTLTQLNITTCDISISKTDRFYQPCVNIGDAEAAETYQKLIETRSNDISENSKRGFKHGMSISAINYIKNKKIIKQIKKDFFSLLKHKVDAIIMPTTIITAPKFNERRINVCGKMLDLYESLNINNVIFNSIGFPTVNIPAGLTKDLMPIGIQIVGLPFDETKILSISL